MKTFCAPNLWAVVDHRGLLLHFTVDQTRREAVKQLLMLDRSTTWRQWYRKGFRAIRVKVVAA